MAWPASRRRSRHWPWVGTGCAGHRLYARAGAPVSLDTWVLRTIVQTAVPDLFLFQRHRLRLLWQWRGSMSATPIATCPWPRRWLQAWLLTAFIGSFCHKAKIRRCFLYSWASLLRRRQNRCRPRRVESFHKSGKPPPRLSFHPGGCPFTRAGYRMPRPRKGRYYEGRRVAQVNCVFIRRCSPGNPMPSLLTVLWISSVSVFSAAMRWRAWLCVISFEKNTILMSVFFPDGCLNPLAHFRPHPRRTSSSFAKTARVLTANHPI